MLSSCVFKLIMPNQVRVDYIDWLRVFAVLLLIYDLCIKRWNPIRCRFGMKPKKAPVKSF